MEILDDSIRITDEVGQAVENEIIEKTLRRNIYSMFNIGKILIREKLNPIFAGRRRKKLIGTDFTIISNNCWGGHVYRFFGIPYNSPTIGLFFFAEDYIMFLSELKGFLNCDLEFITREESRHRDILKSEEYEGVPIGKLCYKGNAIEIIFLHYGSEKEAYEKWTRRVKRVNFNRLLIKNSYQNLCTDEILNQFAMLPYKNKVFFVHKPFNKYDFTVVYRECIGKRLVSNDTNNFKKYVNLYRLINSVYESY